MLAKSSFRLRNNAEQPASSPVPDVAIAADGAIGSRLHAIGITHLPAAARFIRCLPYGRVGGPEEVLVQGRGTCSTKHAAFVLAAREAGIDARLVAEFFEMNDANTPGVGPVLAAAGLGSILEAHCRADIRGRPVDLTGLDDGETPVSILAAFELDPTALHTKPMLHRERLAAWARERYPERTIADLWAIRECCIQALADKENTR